MGAHAHGASLLLSIAEQAITQLVEAGKLSFRLSPKCLGRISQVSTALNSLFQPARLGWHIIGRADLEAVQAMLEKNLSLLTKTITITDHSKRQLEGTPLQLALGAQDVKYHDKEQAMVELIEKQFEPIENGKIIAEQQTRQQLPKGWEKEHEARIARDRAALDAFVLAIANSDNRNNWEEAAVIYRKHIDNENVGKGMIKTGLHSNGLLVAAWFKAYNDNYTAFGDRWDAPKNVFLWQKGSYCERYLTTSSAMALARGIWKIVDEGKPLDRNLNYPHGGSRFFPLDSDLSFRLGFDYAAVRGANRRYARGDAATLDFLAAGFFNYVKQKTSTLQRLTQECNSNLETKPHHSK